MKVFTQLRTCARRYAKEHWYWQRIANPKVQVLDDAAVADLAEQRSAVQTETGND